MNLRQAAQQALEALEILDGVMRRSQRTDAAVAALKQALAEPEQEPVPWEQFYPDIGKPQTTHWEGCEAVHPECRKPDTDCHAQGICQRSGYSIAPAPRKPLELTDSEVDDLTLAVRNERPLIVTPLYVWCRHFSRAVIAVYEAKNGITGDSNE